MRFLRRTDNALLDLTSRAVRFASDAAGVTYPLVLLVWRGAFCGTVVALAAASPMMLPARWAVLVLLAGLAVAGSFWKDAESLGPDAKRDWDRQLFSSYAAECGFKRHMLAPARLLGLFILAVFLALGAAMPFADVPEGGIEIWAFFAVFWMSVLSVLGGYIEACDPPPPGSGQTLAVAAPSVT